ncbi:MAG: COP23 domain-containing protein [Calothrix sp. MO_192.B10]|nr:COP23 domain-containing protein [Calothrix sp. MO_192.B10]
MMNLQSLTPILGKTIKILGSVSLTIFAIPSFLHQPSYANSRTFYCAKLNGVPITFTRTRYGKRIPFIYWNKSQFPPPWTPLQRCVIVSWRFQRNFDNGTLKIIKTGILRKQPVVCGVTRRKDSCTSNTLLFTLPPDSNPKRVLLSLLNRHRSSEPIASARRVRRYRRRRYRGRRQYQPSPPKKPPTSRTQVTEQSGAAFDGSVNSQNSQVTETRRQPQNQNRDGIYVDRDSVYVDMETYLK